jgi:dihydroflavonol-4-reductase
MRVAVTGGTGFVGGHVVKRLVAADHEPRLLVRDPAKLDRMRSVHALGPLDHVVGDITDAASVARLLEGADACLHAAAVSSFKTSEGDAITANNVTGGRIVLDGAVAAGCDPIVHLSTVSAVFPPQGPVLTPDDPVTDPVGHYSASKAALDRYARALQDAGHPVVIVYPGGCVGPDDAGVNLLADGMSRILNSGFLAFPQGGGNIWVDVRDLADAVARMVEPGRGPRRYMAGGNFVPWTEFIELVQELTSGDYVVQRPTNDELMAMTAQLEADATARGEDPPLDMESAQYMCEAVPADDSRLLEEFGISWRPAAESWGDMLRWCAEHGVLAPERSEKLLGGAR